MSSQAQSGPSLEPVQQSSKRLLITGSTGVLGRALVPLAEAAGHQIAIPRHEELDLFDASAVGDAVRDVDERVSAERFSQSAGWHPDQ